LLPHKKTACPKTYDPVISVFEGTGCPSKYLYHKNYALSQQLIYYK
jgi:hypothetical protein